MNLSDLDKYKISVNDRYDWKVWQAYLDDPTVIKALTFLDDFPAAERDLPIYKFQFYANGKLYGMLFALQGNNNSPKVIAESIAIASGVFVRFAHISEEESW